MQCISRMPEGNAGAVGIDAAVQHLTHELELLEQEVGRWIFLLTSAKLDADTVACANSDMCTDRMRTHSPPSRLTCLLQMALQGPGVAVSRAVEGTGAAGGLNKVQLLEALRTELSRLQSLQRAKQQANRALDALAQRLQPQPFRESGEEGKPFFG